jgi:hypothetical protein
MGNVQNVGTANTGDSPPPDCMDVDVDDGVIPGDPPTQLNAWYPSCDDPIGFEDDWFISLVYLYCSASVDGQGAGIRTWRIEAQCSWPKATGRSGHGCVFADKEANGADAPGWSFLPGIKFIFEQDTPSDSPEGQYSILTTSGLNGGGLGVGSSDCVYPAGTTLGNEGGLSGSVFANLKATVS